MKFLGFVNKLYDKKISSKGLAVFRICFALNLFFEVNRIFRYRQLYFDTIPFLEPSNINFTIPLIIWMFVLVCIVFGVFTRIMAIINYGFVLWIFNTVGVFEYHMDYTYLGVSFLMPFVPLSKSISIDSLREKLKYSNTKYLHHTIEKTSALYYFIIIFVGIALVYFGSVFYKFKSVAWMSGLGIWLPASIPQVTILNDQWLLNQEYFIKITGYFVLIFEVVFPFVFFTKKLRSYLLLIGVFLHLGILLEFPIPYFALGYIAIYLLMVPVGFWSFLQEKIQCKTPKLIFFYDADCLKSMQAKIIFSHFDIFKKIRFNSIQELASKKKELKSIQKRKLPYVINKKGKVFVGIDMYKKISGLIPLFYPIKLLISILGVRFLANKIIEKKRLIERFLKPNPKQSKRILEENTFYKSTIYRSLKIKAFKVFFLMLLFFQFNVILSNTIIKKAAKSYPTFNKPLEMILSFKKKLNYRTKQFLGITGHGVFIDEHYNGFDKIFNLTYKGKLLPMYDEHGMVDYYLVGGSWANYNFRVNKPYVLNNPEHLKNGLIRYASFWAHKNDIDLNDSEFKVIKKNIYLAFEWKKDLLKNNLATPWEDVGKMIWKNNKATVELNKLNVEN